MPEILSSILHVLQFAFAIGFLLGGVIAVHELGHFLFAKWNGIRVDIFSIGFGPKIWSRKYGETEYCLSIVPLGGFVKIYGQDPEEVAADTDPRPDRSFSHKSLGAKVAVLFGGPLFNYILAILIFSLLAMVGIEKLPPVATRVVNSTAAYEAGLRSGDVIRTIEGAAVTTFEDVLEVVGKNPEKELSFGLTREGLPLELKIKIQKEHALTPYGEPSVAGLLEGLDPMARKSVFATTLENHPWGLKKGDLILEFFGTPVESWEEIEKSTARFLLNPPQPPVLSLVVQRGKERVVLNSPNLASEIRNARKDIHSFLEEAKLHSPELFLQEVMKGAPADRAGLKAGDRIVSINGKKVYSFEHLRSLVQGAGENRSKEALATNQKDPDLKGAVKVILERNGATQEVSSDLQATKGKDLLGETIVTYTVGILSGNQPKAPSNLITERTINPFLALWLGSKETVKNTVMTVVGIKKLITGEVSAKTVGGPIMIGKIAGDTFSQRGWIDFLRIMAIISISLGVFNLIPIPILDGGHIVFAVLESIRGRPLSQKAQQAALKVGLSLILLLMVFAFYNDITRFLPVR
jgi:regulator of sigma E protease